MSTYTAHPPPPPPIIITTPRVLCRYYLEDISKRVGTYWCQKSCNTCSGSGGSGSGNSDDMLATVNAERSRRGLSPLRLDSRLMRAAQKHSEYQQSIGTMTHAGPAGPLNSFFGRIKAEGIANPGASAENVAAGQRSVADVMSAWMNSPGHFRNLMNPSYNFLGWGRSSGNYWTQVFSQNN